MDVLVWLHPERFAAGGATVTRLNIEVVDVRCGSVAGAKYRLRRLVRRQ
jgi:hypothetical protein